MVFLDGGAIGATLKKHYRGIGTGELRPEASIDYERMGALVCGQGREFVRLNYYTAKPAFYGQRNLADGTRRAIMGDIELLPHEVNNADRALNNFKQLKDHIDRRCRYTTLLNGRMVPTRVETSLKNAVDWVARWTGWHKFGNRSEPVAKPTGSCLRSTWQPHARVLSFRGGFLSAFPSTSGCR
jgi:hypothetical protein